MIVAVFGSVLAGTRWSDATSTPKLALDLVGGTQLILQPIPTETTGREVTSDDINQAIAVIRQRVDASGVAEAEISSQGGNNIVVSLPGTPSRATLDLVTTSAKMEFRPVLVYTPVGTPTDTPSPTATDPAETDPADGEPAEDGTDPATGEGGEGTDPATDESTAEPTEDPSRPAEPSSPSDVAYYVTAQVQQEFDELDCTVPENRLGRVGKTDAAFVTCDADPDSLSKYILGPVEVEGARIAKASSGLETLANGVVGTRWVVNLEFDSKGTSQFGAVSKRLLPLPEPTNRFGIVLDGLVVSAPSINAEILNGKAEISGSFDRTSAATLAQQLRFGSLPVSFEKKSEDRISATLGSEQLQKGLIAGLIGLLLVVVYSVAQYRVLGLLTVGSLGIAAVSTYGFITLLSWTQGYRLSLAGVGGLIVAIGITADSFIVYFERIRDELREGRTLGAAVEHGWARARRTILASDAVNFLAAIVLYVVSVGGVRGFAFTLGLTTLIDLVVVFGFTHPMMQIIARHRFFAEGHALSGLDPRRLGVAPRYAGRGRVSRPAAASDVSDADEPDTLVPAGPPAMTIAERRAAARRAGADPAVDPSDDEGSVR
ncbi:MAG: protein translocase subunit SecD [Micrococcales bacterium]|nr:protein translocase subunit SecD [Micrococcales bacterium]